MKTLYQWAIRRISHFINFLFFYRKHYHLQCKFPIWHTNRTTYLIAQIRDICGTGYSIALQQLWRQTVNEIEYKIQINSNYNSLNEKCVLVFVMFVGCSIYKYLYCWSLIWRVQCVIRLCGYGFFVFVECLCLVNFSITFGRVRVNFFSTLSTL